MTQIVILAGFDKAICDEVKKMPHQKFSGDKNSHLVCIESRYRFKYGKGYRQKVLSKVTKIIEQQPHNSYNLVLLFVDYKNQDTKEFLADFFPFCLPMSVEYLNFATIKKSDSRREISNYLKKIRDIAGEGREKSRQVSDYFSGKNYCSVLLPKGNFRSKVLASNFELTYQELENSSDIRALLTGLEAEIFKSHPKKRFQKKSSFIDDRGLVFKSPGSDRHGMARSLMKPHFPSCFIASRIRFGGDFDPAFHFDCEVEGKTISATFPNCHGELLEKKSASHVNIAPNDFVR